MTTKRVAVLYTVDEVAMIERIRDDKAISGRRPTIAEALRHALRETDMHRELRASKRVSKRVAPAN